MLPFTTRVQRHIRRIPNGRVTTYGRVAEALGAPGAARAVASALAALPEGSDVPWWRVVNAAGKISLPGSHGLLQRSLLEAEGVRFTRGGRVELARYGTDG